MPYAYDIAGEGFTQPLDVLLVATNGFISSETTELEPEPGPELGAGTGTGTGTTTWRRARGRRRFLYSVPGESPPADTPVIDEPRVEEDLPLEAAFAVAEEISDMPRKALLFRLAWIMRKRRR